MWHAQLHVNLQVRKWLERAGSSGGISYWVQGKGAYGAVYKGLRGGVQDVAVKQLVHGSEAQLHKFSEVWVRPQSGPDCMDRPLP
jgi:hypothetical protein